MPSMYNDAYKMISDLPKLFIEPDVIFKRGIDLISVDIHKKKNQLKEVVIQLKEVFIRYSAQMNLNKMREKYMK